MSRSQLWAALLLVATFAAGAVVGGIGTTTWGSLGARQRSGDTRRGTGASQGSGYVSYLAQRLGLDSAQRDTVRAIVRGYDPAMRRVMEDLRPRFDSIRAQVHADVLRVLNDSQQAEFRKLAPRWNPPPDRRRSRDRDRDKD